MLVAFLIALLLCIVLGVYALRVAGERNRWRDRAEASERPVYGRDVWVNRDALRDLVYGAKPKAKRRK